MSGEVYIKKSKMTNNFTVLPNALINDKRLSWPALGLLSYLLSLPPDYRLKLKNLANVKPGCGRDATRSAIAKIEAAGYLQIVKIRVVGKFAIPDWYVSNVTSKPPETGFPDTVNPCTENPNA